MQSVEERIRNLSSRELADELERFVNWQRGKGQMICLPYSARELFAIVEEAANRLRLPFDISFDDFNAEDFNI